MFQLIWAFRAWVRPGEAVLAAGVLVNLGSVALWVLTRTDGAPFGPHAGEPEVVQAAGICALLLECYVVIGAAWLWRRGQRAGPVGGLGYGLVLIGTASVIGVAVTVGVASGLQHDHHSPVGAEHDHRTPDSEDDASLPEPPAPVAPTDSPTAPEPDAPDYIDPLPPAGMGHMTTVTTTSDRRNGARR